ncbi:MAG: hypothetical protein ACRCZP_14500 [Phycicoccus sp.]
MSERVLMDGEPMSIWEDGTSRLHLHVRHNYDEPGILWGAAEAVAAVMS